MALILLVDDECPDRKNVKKSLAEEGYRILSIDDPAATWAYITKFKPDLVLLNGLSEKFQSYEILNSIKKKWPEFPVLVYMVKDDDGLKKLKQAIALALFEVRFSRSKKGPSLAPPPHAGQLRTSFSS